jgi:hypothetical protein
MEQTQVQGVQTEPLFCRYRLEPVTSPTHKQMFHRAAEINHCCWHFNKQLLLKMPWNEHGSWPKLLEEDQGVIKLPIEKARLGSSFIQTPMGIHQVTLSDFPWDWAKQEQRTGEIPKDSGPRWPWLTPWQSISPCWDSDLIYKMDLHHPRLFCGVSQVPNETVGIAPIVRHQSCHLLTSCKMEPELLA